MGIMQLLFDEFDEGSRKASKVSASELLLRLEKSCGRRDDSIEEWADNLSPTHMLRF